MSTNLRPDEELVEAAALLSVSIDADEAAIRAAFRAAARAAHPDWGGQGGDMGKLKAARDYMLRALIRADVPWLA